MPLSNLELHPRHHGQPAEREQHAAEHRAERRREHEGAIAETPTAAGPPSRPRSVEATTKALPSASRIAATPIARTEARDSGG
jgi:hypothetical protein